MWGYPAKKEDVCNACNSKDLMIEYLKSDIERLRSDFSRERDEFKRTVDRLLIANHISPVGQGVTTTPSVESLRSTGNIAGIWDEVEAVVNAKDE